MKKGEMELCKICKKGYLSTYKMNIRSLLTSHEIIMIDCSNKNCDVHKKFLEDVKMYNESFDVGKKRR